MKNLCFILLLALVMGSWCVATTPPARTAAILPDSFRGWQKDAASDKIGSNPSAADSADAPVLKEYGFSDSELATYTRDDRKMQVKAARFDNAGGAYGAFTYYVRPQMAKETIGDEAASENSRVLFYR